VASDGRQRNDELIKKIGARIREIRQEKGMSQPQLANSCNVEISTINRIELGKASPSISLLFRIAEHLGVTPSELIDFQQ